MYVFLSFPSDLTLINFTYLSRILTHENPLQRGRAFLCGQEVEASKVVCGPYGMKGQRGFLAPLYSLGEDGLIPECLLPLNHELVTNWFQEVAMGGKEYANPEDYEIGKEPLVEEPEEKEEVVIDPEWVSVLPIKEHPGLSGGVDEWG